MRFVVSLLSMVVVASTACGDSEGPADAGARPDQGVVQDAGPTFGCGTSACVLATEYCLQTPTAACESRDGGPCAEGEEPCVKSGVTGCTTPLDRRCEVLPVSCGPPLPCACLPDLVPCPSPGATCFRPTDGGPIVTCDFP